MRNVRETLAHWKWCVWEGALHFLATFPRGPPHSVLWWDGGDPCPLHRVRAPHPCVTVETVPAVGVWGEAQSHLQGFLSGSPTRRMEALIPGCVLGERGESSSPWKSQPESLHGHGDSGMGEVSETPGPAPSWPHRCPQPTRRENSLTPAWTGPLPLILLLTFPQCPGESPPAPLGFLSPRSAPPSQAHRWEPHRGLGTGTRLATAPGAQPAACTLPFSLLAAVPLHSAGRRKPTSTLAPTALCMATVSPPSLQHVF